VRFARSSFKSSGRAAHRERPLPGSTGARGRADCYFNNTGTMVRLYVTSSVKLPESA
jgi:hypothetical protein